MRLLNSETFQLKEFSGSVPEYAILSHTWGDSEVTFQDIQHGQQRDDEGFMKLRNCCAQACEDGYSWVWIDTCCIDKTSSAELSEAINSMFKWYAESAVCYVYLSDVPVPNPHFPENEFKAARWFTRGWCLQELIAPQHVEFYAAQWTDIGTKESLMDIIHDATGIDRRMLGESDDKHDMSFLARETASRSHFQRCADRLSRYSAAERMSWASARQTSRTEDMAYSLLGIFQINMPLLYGEGSKAFYRLQEEIMRLNPDLSLLLWCTKTLQSETFLSELKATEYSVLAASPEFFRRQGLSLSLQKDCKYNELVATSRQVWPDKHGTWHPAQLIGGGLSIQMAVGRRKQSKNRNSLIAWTGFECRRGFVCVELLPVAWANSGARGPHIAHMYGRHGPSRVILVGEEEYSRFHVSEVYLSLKSVATELFTYIKGHIRTPNDPANLSIKMPFNESQSVFLTESFPPQDFVSKENWNILRTVQTPGTVKLYCKSLDAKHFEECTTLQLKFRVATSAADGGSDDYVVVDLALRYSFLRCRVVPCQGFDSLKDRADINRSIGQRFYSALHERASCSTRGGDVVYVVAKAHRNTEKLNSSARRKGGLVIYTIDIKVRPSVATTGTPVQQKRQPRK